MLDSWRDVAGPCVLVPTMGALHEGHASLIRQGAALAHQNNISGGCLVSIFVNPTQFNDPADLARYPRTLEADSAICQAAGAAAIYAPHADDIYPPGLAIETPPLPAVATEPGLEDAHRPGHFAGVCQVVLRLFHLVNPHTAIFGEKDWQQLQVLTAMTAGLELPIQIVPGPTVREADGLAMSSRNRFLSPDDRRRGLSLSRALAAANRQAMPDEAEREMSRTLKEAGAEIDYAVVRPASSLRKSAWPPVASDTRWRALIAARIGSVRLIDNAPWHS